MYGCNGGENLMLLLKRSRERMVALESVDDDYKSTATYGLHQHIDQATNPSPLLDTTSSTVISSDGVYANLITKAAEHPFAYDLWSQEMKHFKTMKLDQKKVKEFYDTVFFRPIKKGAIQHPDKLFSILEEANGSMDIVFDDSNTLAPRYMFLYAITSNLTYEEMVKNYFPSYQKLKKMEDYLVNAILDICIPSDGFVPLLHKALYPEEESYLVKILKRPYDYSLIDEDIRKAEVAIKGNYTDSFDIRYLVNSASKVIEKLYRYLWDLFSKREAKINLFSAYASSFIQTDLDRKIKEVCKSYKNFITEDEADYLIRECIYVLMNEENPESYLANFFRMYFEDTDSTRLRYLGKFFETISPLVVGASGKGLDESTIGNWATIQINLANDALTKSKIDDDRVKLNEMEKPDDINGKRVYAMEALFSARNKQKASTGLFRAKNKVTNGYIAYKNAEDSVDKQLSGMIQMVKRGFTGDTRQQLIEGKEYSLIHILKKALATAAIFSFSKMGALIYLITGKYLSKKTKRTERRKLLLELQEDLSIIDEKIEDAKADGNKDAKYALMRTKAQLQTAFKRLKSGVAADEKSNATAASLLNDNRDRNIRR